MQKMHKTYPGTGSVATAAAVRIPGTVAYEALARGADVRTVIHIGHPSGIMDVESIAHMENEEIKMDKLAFYRTARTIMEGTVYINNI